jgi:hypothetical protein
MATFGLNGLLSSWSASAYSWRWADPSHFVLPREALERIRAVTPEGAARMYPKAFALESWAHAEPSRVIQAQVADEAVVREALRGLPVHADEEVGASWRERDMVVMPWRVFTEYWPAFCYPSSDDVAVWPASEGWVLAYHHAEFFCWREQKE